VTWKINEFASDGVCKEVRRNLTSLYLLITRIGYNLNEDP